ncbi:hypothetical protein LX95_02917 [Mesonia algae]|uniref:Uncharacterized protein n=1 Tax=Mesonia algae TaxID=213248 RepID=A0A2W7HTC2_9FLAO|nr:hypothetical protein [Mesonia algae]PZW36934.1 hypothetical protein LX95_02917 [Mesonia algae]
MEKEIPLITDEGYEYLIVFKEFCNTPRDYGIVIIDVSIILMDDITPINSLKTFFRFSKLILDYLNENNVVLYYYCDTSNITIRSNRIRKITPQEFRSKLFSIIFEKINSQDFIEKPIKINDPENGHHYTSLICHKENFKLLLEIEKDLKSTEK